MNVSWEKVTAWIAIAAMFLGPLAVSHFLKGAAKAGGDALGDSSFYFSFMAAIVIAALASRSAEKQREIDRLRDVVSNLQGTLEHHGISPMTGKRR